MSKVKDNKTATIVKEVAKKHGVKTRTVYYVINGERNNDAILNDFMELRESVEQKLAMYQDTPLLNAVKALVTI